MDIFLVFTNIAQLFIVLYFFSDFINTAIFLIALHIFWLLDLPVYLFYTVYTILLSFLYNICTVHNI